VLEGDGQVWNEFLLIEQSSAASARKARLNARVCLLLGGETQFSSIIARSVIGGTHVQTPIDHRQHASVFNLRFTGANTVTRRHDSGA